jgi:2-amino-4-hydroxy-6-hydroxymethyldihydropteridine diphosphokinase
LFLKNYLSNNLILFKSRNFKYCKLKKYRYEALIGVGGNIGDSKRRFLHLVVSLNRLKGVQILNTSPILRNPPFGYSDQEDFYNMVIRVSTSMQPLVFLRFLLRLEKSFKRKRSFENAPRTLDLDLIFFDNRVVDHKDLTVPHPEWFKRDSVVIPLAYLEQ